MAEPIRKLGPYTLVSRIGLGGFGVVWLAEKRSAIATTQVALKLPRGEDIDLDAFRQEAAIWIQASGHPNVLPLIDADIYDDQVVIVSEYVADGSLGGWLELHGGKAPSPESACEIMDGVLAGLAHLHARRIIHRDLKPANILLQRETPRLADFGIARLLKSSSHSAQVSGTLAYMAPEAFDGQRNEQTDVWSVGVIFYEMLSGRLPYDQPDIPSFIGAIMRHDPPLLPDSIPEVLRQIVMKALQRDPANRYQSATDMRRDLREAEHQLWLGGRKTVIEPDRQTLPAPQPVLPQPITPQPVIPQPTMPSPLAKTEPIILPAKPTLASETLPLPSLAKKSRRWLWLSGSVVLLLAIALTTGIYLWRNRNDFSKTTLSGHSSNILSVAFSADGRTIASGGAYNNLPRTVLELWDAQTGRSRKAWNGHIGAVYSVVFSPDSKTMASGSSDNTIKLWDVQTGELKQTVSADCQAVRSLAFSPDGHTIASGCSDNRVKFWDAQTGALKQTLTGHTQWVETVAFSPDGSILASGGGDNTIKLWDMKTGGLLQTLTGHTSIVKTVAFSPDGKILASGSWDDTIRLWEIPTGTPKIIWNLHTGTANAIAFSPDGWMLASADSDSTVTLRVAQTGALINTFTGHRGAVTSVGFSPDGKTLASGSADETVKLWQIK